MGQHLTAYTQKAQASWLASYEKTRTQTDSEADAIANAQL